MRKLKNPRYCPQENSFKAKPCFYFVLGDQGYLFSAFLHFPLTKTYNVYDITELSYEIQRKHALRMLAFSSFYNER